MADDGEAIYIHDWSISQPKAILVIAHGMGEHGGRYAALATYLNQQGVSVYAPDHRGHGQTGQRMRHMGFFAPEQGWDRVVGDLFSLCQQLKARHSGLPFFLMGHSMGSFLARDFAARQGRMLQGLILSGTASGKWDALGGRALVRILSTVKSPVDECDFLTRTTMGRFNAAFAPCRTEFDWLSRDPDQVDAYVDDPLCGIGFTLGFYRDLFQGLGRISRRDCFSRTPSRLPIFCFAGSQDPVGRQGKGVTAVAGQYRSAGIRDLELKLYPQGRHEMVNEINRDEVYSDIHEWMAARIPG